MSRVMSQFDPDGHCQASCWYPPDGLKLARMPRRHLVVMITACLLLMVGIALPLASDIGVSDEERNLIGVWRYGRPETHRESLEWKFKPDLRFQRTLWRDLGSGPVPLVISGHWSCKNGTITLDEEESWLFRAGRPAFERLGVAIAPKTNSRLVLYTADKIDFEF